MNPKIPILILSFLSFSAGKLNAQYNFNVIRTFGETGHEIVFASYNPDGNYIITTGTDSSIIIWNAERRTIYRTLTGLSARPNAAVLSPGNEYLFSGGRDNKVSVWDLTAMPPKVIKTLEGYTGPVKTLDLSPDGKYLATGSTGGSVKIWDLGSSSLVFDLRAQNKSKDINSVAYSPDGKILAAGGADGIITLWNPVSGIIMGSQPGQKNGIQQITFSPDGKLLASCGYSNEIAIFQMPGLNNPALLKGHKGWVQTIDFSPDSKNLISGSRDEYIILWDIASGTVLNRSEKQENIVLALDFDPVQPGFISVNYKSADLNDWALSGAEETLWKKPAGITAAAIIPDKIITDERQKAARESSEEVKPVTGDLARSSSMIELFSPVPVQGKTVSDKNSILIIGRVSDPDGVNTLLINKNVIKASEGGIFQFNLSLAKGENIVDLVAINNKGILNEQKFIVDCIAENATAAGEEIPEIAKSKYFALIIGVSEYQSDEINDLDNPVKDAQSLYDVLIARYNFEKENITLLRNPTQKEIFVAFEDMGKIITPNDNFLIFYAGHGKWDEKAKLGYWMPSDASRNSRINWFSNSNLRDFISSIESKHTILIADACFSGSIFKSRAAFSDVPQVIEKLYELPSRKAMTSGVLQEVPDESQFIKYLIKRLNENEDKYLPSESLFSTFKAAVMSNSPNIPQFGVIQNVGDEGGDFIFVKR